MKKTSISSKVIIGIIVVLVVVIGIFAFLNRQSLPEDSSTLLITYQDQVLAEYTVEDLQNMKTVTFDKEIQSGSKGNESGSFTGVPVRTILDSIDPELNEAGDSVVSKASDGYTSVYSMEEITDNDSVTVVFMKDGELLTGPREGGAGPMRIVAADDTYGTRSTMYLCELEIQ